MAFVVRQATKIVNLTTRVGTYGQKKWPIFKKYAVVELRPPSPADIPKAIAEATELLSKAQSGVWKNMTLQPAIINFCVCAEVVMWFFFGECIGKRSWIGYPLPVESAVYEYVSFTYDHQPTGIYK